MTDEMKKQIETAKKIVANGNCIDIACRHDRCPSVEGCCNNKFFTGDGGTVSNISDAHLQAFRAFIAKNEGAEMAEEKRSVPKSNKNRRVIVTLDGIEYEQGLIDGTAIDSHLADLDEMISRRDAYNVKMRAVRKLLSRHATMKARGEFK